jgi:photosystem II stability/assembly factor-like uncharacterized protein
MGSWLSGRRLAVLVLAAAGLFASSAAALDVTDNYRDMRWRLLGPFRGGWATTVAGVPGAPASFYFGSADGGVWRTTDAGVTWTPLFEHEGSASIGALAIAPGDPRILWAGTGQVHARWDVTAGDGVYRSGDGGSTWEKRGLDDTRHIGRIWVDPRNPEVVLVAALGHVFGANEARGVFRTADGGRTWARVLYHNADTGAVDLAADPALPDVVFASLWQVRRHPWLDYFQPTVGPGSGVYRSGDGGRTWAAAGGKGFPAGDLGRISLAVSPGTQARRVWASIQAEKGGGLYRSDDGGANWALVNPDASLASSYTSGIIPDPRQADTLWAVGRSLRRSTDGGKTFTVVRGSPGGDDYHALWIDPADPRRVITGADQGAVVSLNGGSTWSSWYNQPTGQFYRLAADDRFPYRVYSGQQDSGTVGIASRSDYGQLTFRDWSPVGGDERDGDIPDPANPDIVYGAGLGGRLSRWDARTGQVQNVSPTPVSTYGQRPTAGAYRYTWITPLAISSRPPHAIYQGAQVLFQSLDGGKTWATISPDLTGVREGAKGCDGDVPLQNATACGFGAIFAIAPSPAADGVVWVGTDNGRVQLTRDAGAHWTNVTPPDLADWTKVNFVDASAVDAATAYVAADRHRVDDFRPLAWRTHDFGATWTEIGHGLPPGAWVGVVRQDRARRGLLYAGTSRGIHVSLDDGDTWQSLQLNLPTTGINDLLAHGDDLIAATQGRALWALDGLAPVRAAADAAARGSAGPHLIPPAVAYRLAANQNKDTPLPPEEPRGENPSVGALVDYVLPALPAGPVVLEVAGADGAVLRRFRSDASPETPPGDVYFGELWRGAPPRLPAHAGHNRFVWDLRLPRPRAFEYEASIAALPGRPTAMLPLGPFVLPGSYELRLTVDGQTLRQPLIISADPRTTATPVDMRELLDFEREVAAALDRATTVAQAVRAADTRLTALAAEPRARPLAKAIEQASAELARARGGPDEAAAGMSGRLASLETDLESSDAPPTHPQRDLLTDSRVRIEKAETRWRAFETSTLGPLDRRLKALGLTRDVP